MSARPGSATPDDTNPTALTPEREQEIRDREQAATPGPWGFYDGETYADIAADLQMTGRSSYSYRQKIAQLEDEDYWDDAAHENDDEERAAEALAANAAFIADARQAVPALLAELDRVRVSRAEMTRTNADWLEGIGQTHAADMLRYSLDLEDEMTAAEMQRANGNPIGGA